MKGDIEKMEVSFFFPEGLHCDGFCLFVLMQRQIKLRLFVRGRCFLFSRSAILPTPRSNGTQLVLCSTSHMLVSERASEGCAMEWRREEGGGEGDTSPPIMHCDATESNRHVLVEAGAVSVFVQLLDCNDEDVQFYSAAALSNLAVHGMTGHDVCVCVCGGGKGTCMALTWSGECV